MGSLLSDRTSSDKSLHLLRELLGLGLLQLGDPGGGLVAERGAAPVLLDLVGALVEVGLHGLDQLVQRAAVRGLDLKE